MEKGYRCPQLPRGAARGPLRALSGLFTQQFVVPSGGQPQHVVGPRIRAGGCDLRTRSSEGASVSVDAGYSAKDIQVLEGLEAVRKRPGMYIGSTGPKGPPPPGLRGRRQLGRRGARRLLHAHRCRHPRGQLGQCHRQRPRHPGRQAPEAQEAGVEVVLTVLHAGGKFGGEGYKVSGGLHGVGVSVVNALSSRLDVEVKRDGTIWTQTYDHGKPTAPLAAGRARRRRPAPRSPSGPTPTIFETIVYDYDTLATRFRETAFLNKNLKITLTDERELEPRVEEFRYAGGIVDFVKYLNENKETVNAQADLLRGRGRRGRRRGRDAVEHGLLGLGARVRQQHQHPRGRHPPRRLQERADPNDQRVRPPAGHPQGEGREPLRRGHPRGSGRDHLGEAARPAVRGPDQDQARQHRDARARAVDRDAGARPSTSRSTRSRLGDRHASRRRPPRPAPPRARRASSRAARGCSSPRRCPASSPTARSATPRSPRSTSSRATRPAARPSRPATAASRRSCRCAARSSTWSAPA